MNSEIQRDGKWTRPAFDHHLLDPHSVPPAAMAAQIVESLRNVTESGLREIRAAQGEILAVQRLQLARIEQQLAVLKRMDRRLASKIKIRGHK